MSKNFTPPPRIRDALEESIRWLQGRGIMDAESDVSMLMAWVTGIPRLEIPWAWDRHLTPEQQQQFAWALEQKGMHKPWQYIVGEVRFLACDITVTPDVLIPRPETEILVDRVIHDLPPHPVTVYDLCCGSGCIGIGIKKRRPDCCVVLSDLSSAAVTVARHNAIRNRVDVICLEGDLAVPFSQQGLIADVVVCNPPYIAHNELSALPPEVREWEPRVALIAGETGYELYERLAKELFPALVSRGKLYLEIGTGMGGRLQALLEQHGYRDVVILCDWASHQRFVIAERAPSLD